MAKKETQELNNKIDALLHTLENLRSKIESSKNPALFKEKETRDLLCKSYLAHFKTASERIEAILKEQ